MLVAFIRSDPFKLIKHSLVYIVNVPFGATYRLDPLLQIIPVYPVVIAPIVNHVIRRYILSELIFKLKIHKQETT